jgi:hypothetical protein
MKVLLATFALLPAAFAQTAPGPAAAPRTDPLDALVADSPFMSPGGAGRAGVAASAGPLELRSVVFVDGAYQFSIFDQGSGESEWVRIGERGHPFVARSFNRERDTLTVEHQGRTIELALQPAKMASAGGAPAQSPTPLPGPGNAGNRRNNQGPGPVPAPGLTPAGNAPPMPAPGATNAAEAQRLQNLADELRRRRGMGSQMNLPQPKKN